MFVCKSISADHKDIIHDCAYDFYGRRFATCSSDQSVKVWDLGEDDVWKCTASWKTHTASVWKVTWAHPEFGSVLATCSFDRTVAIFEELTVADNFGERNQSHWVKRAALVDSRTSVTDVKFAPKHLGLLLATCSEDGIIRIYEAPDVMLLSQWSPQHELNCKIRLSSIAWNCSRAHPPMIAVGSDDQNEVCGKVILFQYFENSRKWDKIEAIESIIDPVNDVAFAPNVGRSFHLLGVASKDVRILSIRENKQSSQLNQLTDVNASIDKAGLNSSVQPSQQQSQQKYDIETKCTFNDHGSKVWRVCWNITGTIMASSGDDGVVRLYKSNYLGNWKVICNLKIDSDDQIPITPSIINSSTGPTDLTDTNNLNPNVTAKTKYYKFGSINQSTVPLH